MLCVGMILRGNAWYGSKDAFGCPSVDIARTLVQAFGQGLRTKRFGAEMRGALALGPAIPKEPISIRPGLEAAASAKVDGTGRGRRFGVRFEVTGSRKKASA